MHVNLTAKIIDTQHISSKNSTHKNKHSERKKRDHLFEGVNDGIPQPVLYKKAIK